MTSLYLSTGRKPSQLTRKFARMFALILNAKYENRGKRSVEEICARAEKFGRERVAFIYEKHGNPVSIEFYDPEGGWLQEMIKIESIRMPEREKGKRIPENMRIIAEDVAGRKIASLFGLEQEVEDETSLLEGEFSGNAMAFRLADEEIMGIRCKLIEKAGNEGEK